MSSSDISDTENSKTVLGFQFEPIKKTNAADGSWQSYDEGSSDDENLTKDLRKLCSVSSWCDCKECVEMSTEQECLCCHELESAHLYELGGKLVINIQNWYIYFHLVTSALHTQ